MKRDNAEKEDLKKRIEELEKSLEGSKQTGLDLQTANEEIKRLK